MTLTELTNIIRTANRKAITDELKRLGYIYCNEHRKLGKVGIVPLVLAVTGETENFTDSERKHLYNGHICGIVKGYENYKFVYVNVFDIKPSADPFDDEETAIQTEMLIFAKEMTK